jgi:16S rRNA (guanine966-N2)-methyltransferase
MRIVSGSHKGRRITAPKKLPVRPTTDFTKEALFNILSNRFDFDELEVLDLFAGTGNISYEFASRGVPQITCVDAHFGCAKFIHKTAEEFSFPITTVKSDAYKYLNASNATFDIIYADPPYAFQVEQFENLVEKIFQKNSIKSNGILIIEHSKQTDLSKLTGYQESRRYGSSTISFFGGGD